MENIEEDKYGDVDSSEQRSELHLGGSEQRSELHVGYPSAWMVLTGFFTLFFLFLLLGGLATIGLGSLTGNQVKMDGDMPLGSRNFVRIVLLISQFSSFIIPAMLVAWLFYKKDWLSSLSLDKAPSLKLILLGCALLMVAIPFVQYVYMLNMRLPLPHWMMDMEQNTDKTLEHILVTDHPYEFVFNLILIGLVPGIGEELVFRGTIQKQMGRLISNPHVTIWLSAAIFSFIHFQFQGFFARMVLGALLGYLFYWTKNLWVPIAAHFLNNGMQVAAMYFSGVKVADMEKASGDTGMTIWIALASLTLVIGLGHYLRDTYLNDSGFETVD